MFLKRLKPDLCKQGKVLLKTNCGILLTTIILSIVWRVFAHRSEEERIGLQGFFRIFAILCFTVIAALVVGSVIYVCRCLFKPEMSSLVALLYLGMTGIVCIISFLIFLFGAMPPGTTFTDYFEFLQGLFTLFLDQNS